MDTYRPFVQRLLDEGHAYYCWCSTERLAALRAEQQAAKQSVTGYDRLCVGLTREQRAVLPGFSDVPVVRMLIPDDVPLTFTDLIRGEVSAPGPDDQVILKADGFPTYHLAVVVDDHLMGITHVVRGEEWISSTPKHLLLYRWLGLEPPAFAHMPLLRNPDKSKISKRKNPAARLTWFVEQGYLPEALRNFLQLLAYPPLDDEHEVSSFEEFVAGFEWAKVNTVGPIFDLKKLYWLNGQYLRSLPVDDLTDRIVEFAVREGQWSSVPDPADVALLRRAVPLVQERLVLLSEAVPKLAYLFTADADVKVDPEALARIADASSVVAAAVEALSEVGEWNHLAIQEALRQALVEGLGLKPKFAFAPVRLAITGSTVSPPLFESMELLGRASSLARLEQIRES